MSHSTVVFAPHDDGYGAFSILGQLARALLRERPMLRFVFLSGSRTADDLRAVGLDPSQANIVKTDNLVVLPKDEQAKGVDPSQLADGLLDALPLQYQWGPGEEEAEWDDVRLAISMGVPWLHRAARERGIRSVEVGDMCWSLVLRGTLQSGDCLTPELSSLLDEVACCERMAVEAWLLPFAAPPAYVKHFSAAGVRVNWIPGVFSSPKPVPSSGWPDIRRWKTRLHVDSVVGVHGGRTGVWNRLYRDLGARPVGDPAFLAMGRAPSGEEATGRATILGATGKWVRLPAMTPSLVPLYAQQDLGVTRGGITVLDHIAARCPLAITEEPHHWLSRQQRLTAVAAGICVPISLESFRSDPDGLARGLLKHKSRLQKIRLRMSTVPTEAEAPLAEYLAKRFF